MAFSEVNPAAHALPHSVAPLAGDTGAPAGVKSVAHSKYYGQLVTYKSQYEALLQRMEQMKQHYEYQMQQQKMHYETQLVEMKKYYDQIAEKDRQTISTFQGRQHESEQTLKVLQEKYDKSQKELIDYLKTTARDLHSDFKSEAQSHVATVKEQVQQQSSILNTVMNACKSLLPCALEYVPARSRAQIELEIEQDSQNYQKQYGRRPTSDQIQKRLERETRSNDKFWVEKLKPKIKTKEQAKRLTEELDRNIRQFQVQVEQGDEPTRQKVQEVVSKLQTERAIVLEHQNELAAS